MSLSPPKDLENKTSPENKSDLENKQETGEQKVIEQAPPKTEGKYKITEFNGPVKIPKGYSTNDEDEYNAIQFLNGDLSSWKLRINKPEIKVYSKMYKAKSENGKENDNAMFYVDATLNFPASEVNKQLFTYELLEKWEKSLEKGKLIKEENLSNNIKIIENYAYIKMPFIYDDRDMISRKKVFMDYQGEKDCYLCHTKSIQHPDFPEKKKVVRAIFENRGKYVKPINEKQCKFYLASKFNMKVTLGISLLEVKGSEGQEDWIKDLIKNCGK